MVRLTLENIEPNCYYIVNVYTGSRSGCDVMQPVIIKAVRKAKKRVRIQWESGDEQWLNPHDLQTLDERDHDGYRWR